MWFVSIVGFFDLIGIGEMFICERIFLCWLMIGVIVLVEECVTVIIGTFVWCVYRCSVMVDDFD